MTTPPLNIQSGLLLCLIPTYLLSVYLFRHTTFRKSRSAHNHLSPAQQETLLPLATSRNRTCIPPDMSQHIFAELNRAARPISLLNYSGLLSFLINYLCTLVWPVAGGTHAHCIIMIRSCITSGMVRQIHRLRLLTVFVYLSCAKVFYLAKASRFGICQFIDGQPIITADALKNVNLIFTIMEDVGIEPAHHWLKSNYSAY